MSIAADGGVALRMYYSNAEDALSLSDYVVVAPHRGSDSERLVELAHLVRSIHDLPLFTPYGDFMDGIDGFIENFNASGLLPGQATVTHLELYAQIQEHYPRHTQDLVSSHNDLNPSNLLYDGNKFWVVDWETAFRNDRYLDLATNFNFSGSDQEELYLGVYFGQEPTPYKRALFFLMRQVCYFSYGLSLMQAVAATRTPDFSPDPSMDVLPLSQFHAELVSGGRSLSVNEDRLLYAKALLNEALQHMRTPRFAESIDQLKFCLAAKSRLGPSN